MGVEEGRVRGSRDHPETGQKGEGVGPASLTPANSVLSLAVLTSDLSGSLFLLAFLLPLRVHRSKDSIERSLNGWPLPGPGEYIRG